MTAWRSTSGSSRPIRTSRAPLKTLKLPVTSRRDSSRTASRRTTPTTPCCSPTRFVNPSVSCAPSPSTSRCASSPSTATRIAPHALPPTLLTRILEAGGSAEGLSGRGGVRRRERERGWRARRAREGSLGGKRRRGGEGAEGEAGGAEVVYANYGRMEDFEELVAAIGREKVTGTVALIRYGKTFRGDKVRNAEKFGVAAVLLYSDPADYAPEGTDASHVYPQAEWLPATGAQRGTVYTGRPCHPGWPSHPGGERLSDEETAKRLPRIPVLPVSYSVAAGIMAHMGGAAVHHPRQPSRCMGVWGSRPNSGTTCLLEVARAFGHMAARGWSPRRSIVFASWDAEEYGCLGSTEWAEDNAPVLATKAIAYINVDVAVGGGGFHASATPQLDDLIRDVSSQVANPDGPAGQSLLEGWAAEHNVSEPEAEAATTAFLQHLGIAAADTHFGGSYPMYHSVYDNYHWMATFADPLFKRHVAVAKMMAGVAARLAGDHRLPFNYSAYAAHLGRDVARLQSDLASQGAPPSLSVDPLLVSVSRLLAAAQSIDTEAQHIAASSSSSRCTRGRACPMEGASGEGANCGSSKAMDGVNERLFLAERGFLDGHGIGPHYTWFKHLVYGPEKDNDYATSPFPGIRDAIADVINSNSPRKELFSRRAALDAESAAATGVEVGTSSANDRESDSEGSDSNGDQEGWKAVQHEIFRAARAIERAAKILEGQLL
ncbi:hypothetical protein CLOM_g11356 [Closterium sp. NIES-68]|nr:hypothetical protein CLOM_g11356 [Closterium sp. NIES-68]